MSILVTGTSGFIAQRVIDLLSETCQVVCMSRKRSELKHPNITSVRGSFDCYEDLTKLDGIPIDAVIHLAAVTGGSSEEEAMSVNVLGSRRLYRYLLNRGCRKFIAASSIAAVGCLDSTFRPIQIPIPDDHPCLATDAYGLSKSIVEEMTRYYYRIYPDAQFINFRLGAVTADPSALESLYTYVNKPMPFARLAHVHLTDVVDAVLRAVNTPVREQPGVSVYNLVGPDTTCNVTTIEILKGVLGEDFANYDLSFYEEPGNEKKPLYGIEKIQKELGFEPSCPTRNNQ